MYGPLDFWRHDTCAVTYVVAHVWDRNIGVLTLYIIFVLAGFAVVDGHVLVLFYFEEVFFWGNIVEIVEKFWLFRDFFGWEEVIDGLSDALMSVYVYVCFFFMWILFLWYFLDLNLLVLVHGYLEWSTEVFIRCNFYRSLDINLNTFFWPTFLLWRLSSHWSDLLSAMNLPRHYLRILSNCRIN